MIRRIHHIGIVVRQIDEAFAFYREILGLPLIKMAEVRDQGVKAALLAAGGSEIELLEPIAPGTGVGKFLERRGEGMHHCCFESDGIESELEGLRAKGVELIDQRPREGLAGRIAFLHPRACHGVLVELAHPRAGEYSPTSPLRLHHLAVVARDPRGTAALYHDLFGLPFAGEWHCPAPYRVDVVNLAVGDAGLEFVGPADLSSPLAEAEDGMYLIALAAPCFEEGLERLRRGGTAVKDLQWVDWQFAGGRPTERYRYASLDPGQAHGVRLALVESKPESCG